LTAIKAKVEHALDKVENLEKAMERNAVGRKEKAVREKFQYSA